MSQIVPEQWLRRSPHPFPPPWAGSWGDDTSGLWADTEISRRGAPTVQRMRWVEPGQLLMGSAKGELEAQDREHPQHLVTISQGLWLADTACTQALWRSVMESNPSHFDETNRGSPEHPVEQVNWHMVQEFLNRLESLLPGCQATLPTEAEWEYACRAGTTTPFTFGQTITPERVNYDGNFPYGNRKRGKYRESTVAVKELSANAWGLYQMHGNVWEWCADTLRKYRSELGTDPGLAQARNPRAGDKGFWRVLRGGCWLENAGYARSAARDCRAPDRHDSNSGFRFALRAKNQTSAKKPG